MSSNIYQSINESFEKKYGDLDGDRGVRTLNEVKEPGTSTKSSTKKATGNGTGKSTSKKTINESRVGRSASRASLTESEEGAADYTKVTANGYEIVATYTGEGHRYFVVAYRPKVGDYAFGCGYDVVDGTWGQGGYDYSTEDEAADALMEYKAPSVLTYYGKYPPERVVNDDEKGVSWQGLEKIRESERRERREKALAESRSRRNHARITESKEHRPTSHRPSTRSGRVLESRRSRPTSSRPLSESRRGRYLTEQRRINEGREVRRARAVAPRTLNESIRVSDINTFIEDAGRRIINMAVDYSDDTIIEINKSECRCLCSDWNDKTTAKVEVMMTLRFRTLMKTLNTEKACKSFDALIARHLDDIESEIMKVAQDDFEGEHFSSVTVEFFPDTVQPLPGPSSSCKQYIIDNAIYITLK